MLTVGNYKINWSHKSPERASDKSPGSWGYTQCCVQTPDGKLFLGIEQFPSDSIFCKDIGRKNSLTIALRKVDRRMRANIWNAYNNMSPNKRWEVKRKEFRLY